MSKKNSKEKKRNARANDLQREKDAAAERAKAAEKRQAKANLTGVVKHKSKSARLRKGAVIAGIKIRDSETKRKVRSILEKRKQQKVLKAMDIDDSVKASKKTSGKSKSKGKSEAKAGDAMME